MAEDEVIEEGVFGGKEIDLSDDGIEIGDEVLLDIDIDEDDDSADFGLSANSLDD